MHSFTNLAALKPEVRSPNRDGLAIRPTSAGGSLKARLVTTIILAGAMLAEGCSNSQSPSGGVTMADLAGAWRLESVQTPPQQAQTPPTNSTYSLTFANGTLSARVDCNACSGSFTLSGNTLTVGSTMACTLAACPNPAFESQFTRLLSGTSTVAVSGSSMSITSDRGTLRFQR